MTAKFSAVLDACVLIPMPLADTLLRLAAGPRLYTPRWTDKIMAEVSRNLQENFGLAREQIAYRESEIRRHFPEAWVSGHEALIPSMTNNDKDRHVLAAAVRANADVIVTYNLRDFPPSALAAYGVTAQGPSKFLNNLYELDQEAVTRVLNEQAGAIRKPLQYILDRLRINAPHFCGYFYIWTARAWLKLGEQNQPVKNPYHESHYRQRLSPDLPTRAKIFPSSLPIRGEWVRPRKALQTGQAAEIKEQLQQRCRVPKHVD